MSCVHQFISFVCQANTWRQLIPSLPICSALCLWHRRVHTSPLSSSFLHTYLSRTVAALFMVHFPLRALCVYVCWIHFVPIFIPVFLFVLCCSAPFVVYDYSHFGGLKWMTRSFSCSILLCSFPLPRSGSMGPKPCANSLTWLESHFFLHVPLERQRKCVHSCERKTENVFIYSKGLNIFNCFQKYSTGGERECSFPYDSLYNLIISLAFFSCG